MCWFEHGITSSAGEPRRAEGLGLLPGTLCVHYARDPERRTCLLTEVEGGLAAGYGIDDGAGLLFEGTRPVEAFAGRRGARVVRVERGPDGVREMALRPIPLRPELAPVDDPRSRRCGSFAERKASVARFAASSRRPDYDRALVALPLKPPIKPQLALSRKALPEGEGWAYEPKWDGFRALAFVDGDDVFVQSRGGKPLHRYFPELDFPEGPVHPGRRARDPRLRRQGGVRRASEPDPSSRVADQPPRGGDARHLPRLRHPGRRQEERDQVHADRAPRGARGPHRGLGLARLGRADAASPTIRPRPSRGSRAARA